MPVELDDKSLKTTIESNAIVVVDFWAPWCAPCQHFAPIYEEVATQCEDVVFGKVNTEQHQALAAAFQIRSIPTLMIFRDQILVYNQAGAMSKADFEQLIESVKGLDMDKIRQEIEQENQSNR